MFREIKMPAGRPTRAAAVAVLLGACCIGVVGLWARQSGGDVLAARKPADLGNKVRRVPFARSPPRAPRSPTNAL